MAAEFLFLSSRTDDLVASSLPILVTSLKNSREFVRVEAAMTLGELGPAASSALQALEAATSDSSPAVRSAAAAAIKKIKG